MGDEYISPGWEQTCPHGGRAREDSLWMINSAILVVSMNAAFALLEAGTVQHKNLVNIMMKNMVDLTIGGIVWWLIGFRLAFADPSETFPSSVGDEAVWFFQWTFAATASTIDSGAMAERVNFYSYCILTSLITGFMYPLAVAQIWQSDGYLAQMGFRDFAGGACVHLLGGISALVSAAMLGPRIGRFKEYKPSTRWPVVALCRRPLDPEYYQLPVDEPPLAAVTDPISLVWGVFFLWVGWYGFNAGGVAQIEGAGTYMVARICCNTTLGALGGALVAFLKMMYFDKFVVSPDNLVLGILSGLVSITAGCCWFSNGSSFVIGIMGTMLSYVLKWSTEQMHIDDVVSAFPIHGGSGLFGTVAVGFFAQKWPCGDQHLGPGPVGVFYAESPNEMAEAWRLVQVQLWGCFLVMLYTAVATALICALLNQTTHFHIRLPRKVELAGLDEEEHDMSHGDLDFKAMVQHLIADVAHSNGAPDEVMKAFNTAAKSMSSDTIKGVTKQKSNGRVRSKAELHLRVLSVNNFAHHAGSGFNPFRWGKNRGVYVQVEISSAVPPEDHQPITTRACNFFLPRFTKTIQRVNGSSTMAWDEEFTFKRFAVPAGGADYVFAIVSLFESGVQTGQAYLALGSAPWQEVTSDDGRVVESLVCERTLRVYGHRHRTQPEDAEISLELRLRRSDNEEDGGEDDHLMCGYATSKRKSPAASCATPTKQEECKGCVALEARLKCLEERFVELGRRQELLIGVPPIPTPAIPSARLTNGEKKDKEAD